MNESPVLLHIWSVHPEAEAALVEQLREMFRHASTAPGFLGARLLSSSDRTSVAAVVEMRSPEDRRRLEQLPEVHETLYGVEGAYNVAVRLYQEVATATPANGAVAPVRRAADLRLEVVVLPVTDVDRAKAFYAGLDWRLDADFADQQGFRIVQFTPPGSPCSIQFGTKITTAAPGSATNLYLVVQDVQTARDALAARGVAVSDVFHEAALGDRFNPEAHVAGRAPDAASYGSFASFSDPDGNTWLLQEITTRLPGRVDAAQPARTELPV